jgi:outer membrane receptor protein involved in Fe transport
MIRNKPLQGLIALLAASAASVNVSMAAEEGTKRRNVFLEEVVVTARKKSEDSMDTPLAISAFSSDMLEAAGIKDLTEVANLTPGFSFTAEFGRVDSERPVIRGQSTIKGESGVSTFIDGVLITGSVLDYDINEAERIEIIKGPQSAQYGRNTYSGVISITTKTPGEEISGNVKVEAAEYGQEEISGSIRGPIIEGILAGGITGRSYERGGTQDNIYDGTEVGQQESQSVSGVLYFTPTEDLDIRVRSRWSSLDDDQIRLFLTQPGDNNCFGPDIGGTYTTTPNNNGGFDNNDSRYFCGEIEARPYNVDDQRLLDNKGYVKKESWESSFVVNYQLTDEMSVSWVNGYNRSDTETSMDFGNSPGSLSTFAVRIGTSFNPDGTPSGVGYVQVAPLIDFADVSESDDWGASSELRLTYQGERWSLLVGGYYYKSEDNTKGTRVAPSAFDDIVEESYNLTKARMEGTCVGAPLFLCNPINVAALGPNDPGQLANMILAANRSEQQSTLENQALFAMLEFDITDRLTTSFEVRSAREKITASSVVFAPNVLAGNTAIPCNKDEERAGVATCSATSKSILYQYGVDGALGYGFATGDGLPFLSNDFATLDREETFRSISPRFTAKYAATDDTNVYMVIATGSKPGGFNDIEVAGLGLDSYDEESVLSYELGVKSSLFDGRMRLNAAIYHNTIEDYQLTESVVANNSESVSVIKNAGKVRVQGVEMDVIYALESIDGLTLNANYAFADSSFLEGTDINEGKLLDVLDDGRVNCSLNGGLGADGEPCLDTADNIVPGSIVGRALPNAAKHMANLGANYMVDMSDAWTMIFNVNASYESKKYVQVHNLAWTGARTIVGASVALESENIRLSLWGKNLTDDDTPLSVSRFADETKSFQRTFFGTRRTGRQFGATATYMF